MIDRAEAERLDAADPLAAFVDRFVVDDPDLCYLDGNSLGRLPLATRDRLRAVVEDEWGAGLVRSWDRWLDLPVAVGERLGAGLLGAAAGQTLIADSVTVNLYKLTAAALAADPARRVVVVTDDEFPTDRYVVDGAARAAGGAVRRVAADPVEGVDPDRLSAALGPDTAVVVLSLVSFRSAALADVEAVTERVRRAGALVLWDLCHAVGAVPIELDAWDADLAVGCTYKYLCAGPGAPAFLYVASRHQGHLRSPIQGWFAQRDQFGMGPEFDPVPGAGAFAAGTPSALGLAAVDEGVALVAEAGIDRVRAKGVAMTSLACDLVDGWLAPLGVEVASPRDPARRGNHLTVRHPRAEELGAALVAEAGVVPDTRPPDRIRLGAAPLSSRFTEVWDALDRMRRLVVQRF